MMHSLEQLINNISDECICSNNLNVLSCVVARVKKIKLLIYTVASDDDDEDDNDNVARRLHQENVISANKLFRDFLLTSFID